MSVLRIDSSIMGPNSHSSALADSAEAEYTAVRPGTTFVRRHLAAAPLPADAWAAAVLSGFAPEDQLTDEQRAARALAAELAGELRNAEAVILALPLYNWGVSQHVKTWMDLAIAGGEQGERLLDGKPAIVLTTRGGGYSKGTPREGWDHNTDFLRRIVGDVWGADLTLIELELTLAAVNPAMESLRDTAELMRKAAHEAAIEAGRALAQR
ncbi:NAD(P)H-dependent oxidoreductase [Actinoplanes sp. URMC 104]|uniref:NAD(P)H-dependent oxidoreductase n=1 Tax=Actinoplanes sp. URMC 104 TaxID=3423409 RepID=UPI003F1A18C0